VPSRLYTAVKQTDKQPFHPCMACAYEGCSRLCSIWCLLQLGLVHVQWPEVYRHFFDDGFLCVTISKLGQKVTLQVSGLGAPTVDHFLTGAPLWYHTRAEGFTYVSFTHYGVKGYSGFEGSRSDLVPPHAAIGLAWVLAPLSV
jgi:hypothetical protein